MRYRSAMAFVIAGSRFSRPCSHGTLSRAPYGGRGREEMQAGAVEAMNALTLTGDPLAITYAANIQRSIFQQNILDNIDSATTRLMNAASTVVGHDVAGGSNRVNLSEKLYNVLDFQIQSSKIRERRLWNEVGNHPLNQFFDKDGNEIQQPYVLQLLDTPSEKGGLAFESESTQIRFLRSLGPAQKDIDILRDYYKKGVGDNPATTKRFYEMRTDLLSEAAKLEKLGDTAGARHLNKINDALLHDLTGQKDGVSAAYNTAHAYSVARNNVFTRSFLSALTATDHNRGLVLDPSGSIVDHIRCLVLDPQNLLDAIFKGGNLNTAKRFDQIRAAGRFLVDEGGLTEAEARVMDANELMSAGLRDSLGEFMDVKRVPNPAKPDEMIEISVVNENKLNTWKKKPGTQELFAKIPELQVDLENVVTAQRAFDNLLKDPSNSINPPKAKDMGFTPEQIDRIYATKAFQSVLNSPTSPGQAVAEALASQNPIRSINSLYRMIDETNYEGSECTRDQAMKGFKSAIFAHALHKANNIDGLPNADSLKKSLFGRMDEKLIIYPYSMKDFMIKKGLATKDEMDMVQKAVDTLRGVETTMLADDASQTGSRPVRGAWIETTSI